MRDLWLDKRKRYLILFSCLAFLFVAHAYRWMNTMYSHDSLLIVQRDRSWQISIGRIFNPLYVWLRGYIVAPMNVALFACTFIILSAALIVRMLRLEKSSSIVLCCGFLTTFETITFVNATFLLSLDLDMLALLLSVLAAYFFTGEKSPLRYAAGVLCTTLMLGLFQTYIEVTIMLVCLVLLRDALEGGNPKELFFKGLRSAGLLILGGLLYFICLNVVMKVTGIAHANASNSLAQMGKLTVAKALSLARDAWIFTLRYLLVRPMLYHSGISAWIYRILAVLSVCCIVWIAKKKRLGTKAVALVAFLLLFMPLGGNIVFILSLGFKHFLMNYSFVFFSVLAVLVFDLMEFDSLKMAQARTVIPVLCAVLLLNHVLFSNQWYIRSNLYTEAAMSFMTRLVGDMEDVEGYEVGVTPVLILGHIDQNPAVRTHNGLYFEHDPNIVVMHYMAVSYYQTYGNYFNIVMGYNINLVPLEEVPNYLDDPRIQSMPIYPAKGSVQMIDGVLVVRLSEDLRPEEFTW